jgi:predicted secreted protein
MGLCGMAARREKVVFVCHCVLNQSTRAWWGEAGASRERGMVKDVVGVLMTHGVGAIQMDCPEFGLHGNPRPPRSKDEYNTPEFRHHCREIATAACDEMLALMEKGRDPKVDIVAVIGFENSPSCGVERTTRTIDGRNVSIPGRGHLMDALENEMHRRGLDAPFVGVSLKRSDRERWFRRLEELCMDQDTH